METMWKNYRWANRVKLSNFQILILAAVYIVVGFYLPIYDISDSIQQCPLHLRQWILLVVVIIAYQTAVFHVNLPEFSPLLLLWFGSINQPFLTLLSLPIATLCSSRGQHACAAAFSIGVLAYLHGCHAMAKGSDRMDEEGIKTGFGEIKAIYEKAFEEMVDEAKAHLTGAHDELAALKVTHLEIQNKLLADILTAKDNHQQTLDLLLQELKTRMSDETKIDTTTQQYREQLDAANEKVLSAMTELKEVYKKKSQDSGMSPYWMPQTHSYSMYALKDSQIEKDKHGNWTGPSGSGQGSPAKGRGEVKGGKVK